MIKLVNTSSAGENEESVLFQPVLKAYPICHSWLITAHILLGHLEWHWKSFTRQMDRTCQIIQSLSHQPSALTQLLSALQAELTNINDIYTSYKPIIILAINLLATDPSFYGNSNYNKCARRSLLPFLGDALSWLTGTANTKDINSITTIHTTRSYSTYCIYSQCHMICSPSKQTTHQYQIQSIKWYMMSTTSTTSIPHCLPV